MLSNVYRSRRQPFAGRLHRLCGLAVCLAGVALTNSVSAGVPIRGGASQKGSLLVFPVVEIKWDDDGNVLQDTIIDLGNDYGGHVFVQLYFVNGDEPKEETFVGFPPMRMDEAEPGWNWANCRMMLTANQPTSWSAVHGSPNNCQPFSVLDPPQLYGKWGRPDPETDGATRVLRGYVVAWAVRQNPVTGVWEEIRWNHLRGSAIVLNYSEATAYEYNAEAFQVRDTGISNGGFLPSPGELRLDGVEYDIAAEKLLLDFYGSGSDIFSARSAVSLDTDLALLPLFIDVRQDGDGPVTTKIEVEIWNEFETKFSGTRRCITCWDKTRLSSFVRSAAIPNHFLRTNLRTDKGQARIDGVESVECDGTAEPFFETEGQDAPLVGVAIKILHFNGGVERDNSAMNLVGMGYETGIIFYDISGQAEEAQAPKSRVQSLPGRGSREVAPVRPLEALPVDPTAAE
jgi:hypothetical protein